MSRKAAVVAEERPELLFCCGLVGVIGNLAPLVAIVIAVPLAEHDLIADTVSDLGRGPHRWIMDTGLYTHAAGLLALAIATAHLHLGRSAWSAGIICLSLLALVITLIGLWDQFGNGGPDADLSVHTRLTFLLGPLFLAGPLLMASGASRMARFYPIAFIASAVLWAVFATAFKMAPDSHDGLLEKIAVAATWGWTLPLSVLILQRALGRR